MATAQDAPTATATQTADVRTVGETALLTFDLEPLQGLWSDEQYMRLSAQTNRLIELTDGVIEVLPMPTTKHQRILIFLLLRLLAWVQPRGGDVLCAPLRVQIRAAKFRGPDLLVMLDKHDPRAGNEFWLGADLVVEVVSPDRPERDTVDKPLDYAEAGIPEYWIVNPLDDTITVLAREGTAYVPHGVFHRGEHAASRLLDGVGVAVDEVLDSQ